MRGLVYILIKPSDKLQATVLAGSTRYCWVLPYVCVWYMCVCVYVCHSVYTHTRVCVPGSVWLHFWCPRQTQSSVTWLFVPEELQCWTTHNTARTWTRVELQRRDNGWILGLDREHDIIHNRMGGLKPGSQYTVQSWNSMWPYTLLTQCKLQHHEYSQF